MASDLIKTLNATTSASLSGITENERQELLKAVQGLTASLESPVEVLAKTALGVGMT